MAGWSGTASAGEWLAHPGSRGNAYEAKGQYDAAIKDYRAGVGFDVPSVVHPTDVGSLMKAKNCFPNSVA